MGGGAGSWQDVFSLWKRPHFFGPKGEFLGFADLHLGWISNHQARTIRYIGTPLRRACYSPQTEKILSRFASMESTIFLGVERWSPLPHRLSPTWASWMLMSMGKEVQEMKSSRSYPQTQNKHIDIYTVYTYSVMQCILSGQFIINP